MAQIRGIGGIFFKSENPDALYAWYAKHLGIAGRPNVGAMLPWRRADDTSKEEITVWSIFPASTKYFEPSKAPFMLNYIVDDLDATLAELRAQGVQVDERVERHEYGNFGWLTDPDGNRIELWQPPVAPVSDATP
jgi:catechol 2,3-dioxygenase-like lactoylglutathione lyase family enzyme